MMNMLLKTNIMQYSNYNNVYFYIITNCIVT